MDRKTHHERIKSIASAKNPTCPAIPGHRIFPSTTDRKLQCRLWSIPVTSIMVTFAGQADAKWARLNTASRLCARTAICLRPKRPASHRRDTQRYHPHCGLRPQGI